MVFPIFQCFQPVCPKSIEDHHGHDHWMWWRGSFSCLLHSSEVVHMYRRYYIIYHRNHHYNVSTTSWKMYRKDVTIVVIIQVCSFTLKTKQKDNGKCVVVCSIFGNAMEEHSRFSHYYIFSTTCSYDHTYNMHPTSIIHFNKIMY